MILRTTSQSRSRSTALLVGEPLAKPDTRCDLPRPLLQGEVAMRSIDGEVVSKHGEGYPLKMGALRAGNAESTTRDFE